MDDIIFSVAWSCGDKDCPVQWHQANYWITSEGGYTVDNYSDGDHDDIDEADLPTQAEVDQSWRDYADYVVRHGIDPLGNYMVKHSRKVKEKWDFRFSDSILGFMCVAARHAGKRYSPEKLPEHVRRYLNVPANGRAVLADFRGGKDKFVEMFPKYWQWNSQHIEHDIPRKKELIATELKRIARKQLRTDGERT